MEFKIQQKASKKHQLYIIDDVKKLEQVTDITAEETQYATAAFNAEQTQIVLNRYSYFCFIYLLKNKKTEAQTFEACRKAGSEIQGNCNKHKLDEITINNLSSLANAAILLAEGLALANYQFLKYRAEAKKLTNTLHTVFFSKTAATVKEVAQLNTVVDAVYRVRE